MKENIDFKNDISAVNKEKIFERIPLKKLDFGEKIMLFIFSLFLFSNVTGLSFPILNNIFNGFLNKEQLIIFNFVFSLIISSWFGIFIMDVIKAFSIKRLINRAMILSFYIFCVIACVLGCVFAADLGIFTAEELFKSIKPV